MSWVERVEAILNALNGSSIGEIELAEGDLEVIIRRSPDTIMAVKAPPPDSPHRARTTAAAATHVYQDMQAPLSGVYYPAPSPNSAPFINVGDIVQVGQLVALIEAMKVFSEIPSEVAGRVVAIKVQSGDVVKKGDVLFQIEPLS